MNSSEGIFDLLPSLVSENPKKIIAIVIAFTILMGYFATEVQINSRQESFNPDSKHSEFMNEIEKDFGTSDEIVQVAFIAEDGNVFSKKVLLDTLNTKINLLENEDVNKTLSDSNTNPSGVNTLADMILLTNQTLHIQDQILEMNTTTEKMVVKSSDQTEMYSIVNDTFTIGNSLIELSYDTDFSSSVYENTTKSLSSASDIIMDPSSWNSLKNYEIQLKELLGKLQSPVIPLNTKINETELFCKNLDVASEPRLRYFKQLFEGMNGILKENTPSKFNDMAIDMTVNLFKIKKEIQGKPSNPTSSFDTPSQSLTLEEKKNILSNMSDQEIKEIAHETLTYDTNRMQKNINDYIQESNSNLNNATENCRDSNSILNSLNCTINSISGSKKVSNNYQEFKQYISSSRRSVKKSIEKYNSIKLKLDNGKNIPKLMDQFNNTLSLSVSSDLGSPESSDDIKASSTIALVQMNSSYSSETRKEAQYDIIEISEEECENSAPKIFATQIMNDQINQSTRNSMTTLLPIAFLFVIVVLMIIFRTFTETFVSLLSLVFALVWTFGIGVLLGYDFNPMIIAVPILITGLVIDYGIHMVLRYREEKDNNLTPKKSTKVAILTVGGALVLTTLTTAIGFLSNTFSNISAMRNFGILAAVGICSSFLLMVTFLPSVIQLVENWREKKDNKKKNSNKNNHFKKFKENGNGLINSILSISTDASDKHPFIVIIIVILITISSIYGVANIDTTFSMKDFLPEEMSQSENIDYIEGNFNVSTSYAYILTEGNVSDPTYLEKIDSIYDNIEDNDLTKTNDKSSPLSVLQDYGTAGMNQDIYNRTIVKAFSNSDTDNDGIPDKNVSLLYDLLYEHKISKNSIKSVLYKNDEGRYTKAVIKIKENDDLVNKDNENAKELKEELEDDAEPLEDGYSVNVISNSILNYYTTNELTNTQQKSMIATIIIIAGLLTTVFYFLNRSKILGIITTIPVTLVTLWIIGTMYISGVSLNAMTVNITALTVGIGIDYSVHITHRFLEEKEEQDKLYDAMHDTVQNTGAALFGSAATTMGAFAILSMSQIMPLAKFGFITSIAIGYSFLVAVFVLPSGLMLWAKYKKNR